MRAIIIVLNQKGLKIYAVFLFISFLSVYILCLLMCLLPSQEMGVEAEWKYLLLYTDFGKVFGLLNRYLLTLEQEKESDRQEKR